LFGDPFLPDNSKPFFLGFKEDQDLLCPLEGFFINPKLGFHLLRVTSTTVSGMSELLRDGREEKKCPLGRR
jgi:hypothetical protein